MKNKNILSTLMSVLFVSVLVLSGLSMAPTHVFAQEVGFSGDGGCGCSMGSYSTGTDYGYSPSYSTPSYSTGTDYGYPASYSTPSYSTGTDYGYSPSYSTGYGMGYGMTGGYMAGGYGGGYLTGGGYMTGGGYGYSAPVAPSYSNTYAPTTVNTNTNTCTGNSCNTTITNPAPVINNNNVVANYAQPVATAQQYCASGYYGTYPNCYINQQPIVYQRPPVAYNTATPYVSLSQVPYTGLDLGFWGSIAYWGAFVLFALFAAYLIAIKRVQNTIAAYLKSVLFGSDEVVVVEAAAHAVTAPTAPAPAPETAQGDVIDSFIMSQINRARHA